MLRITTEFKSADEQNLARAKMVQDFKDLLKVCMGSDSSGIHVHGTIVNRWLGWIPHEARPGSIKRTHCWRQYTDWAIYYMSSTAVHR